MLRPTARSWILLRDADLASAGARHCVTPRCDNYASESGDNFTKLHT